MAKWIRSNRSTASPSSLLFLDCEAFPSDGKDAEGIEHQRLWFGVARYLRLENGQETRQDECVFTDRLQCWRFILDKCQRGQTLWLFAHNLGYDLTLVDFWQDLASGEWTLRSEPYTRTMPDGSKRNCKTKPGVFVDGDPPTIIECRHIAGWRLCCVDTLNYFPVKLAELGKSVGLPKHDMPHHAAPDAAWVKYCRRDVEIIERSVVRLIHWVKTHDLGMFRWSAPSQAMAAWRHRFGPLPLNIERSDAVKEVERQSYYGGRVECCYVGKYDHDVYELDVNSMFPSVMRDNHFPCELSDSWEQSGDWTDNYSHPRMYTAAECIIETDSEPYPVRTRDGTYWCTGRFWTTLAGPELCDAWEAGHVKRIGRWATYKMRKLFSEYVEYFWQLRCDARKENRNADEALCKLFLNSLYGKFGQMSPRWQDCEFPDDPWQWGRRYHMNVKTGETLEFRSIAGHCQKKVDPAEHSKSFAAISSWVTSYARLKIREMAKVAGKRNVLYVVTDALYVTRDGYNNLLNAGELLPGELGKLRVKRYGNDAAFWAANDYMIGTHRVLSGVRANARKVMPGLYEETVFDGLDDVLRKEPDGSITVKTRLKRVGHKVKRVAVGDDGWTKPIDIIADGVIHLNRLRQLRRLPSMSELIQ